MIPVLEPADLAEALRRAGKALTDAEQARLKERLDEALRLYMSDRLGRLWGGSPSAVAKQLDRVVKSAGRLLGDVGERGDLPTEAVWLEIRKAAVPTPEFCRSYLTSPDQAGNHHPRSLGNQTSV
jgi:hypothetical protein